jgi:NADH-quinone oxidoreductase subunit G
VTPLAHLADVALAGATFAEKAGSYVNANSRLQYSEAALPPRDGSLPDLDILGILLDRPGGPVDSSAILAEVAENIPFFSAAKGGKLPAYGVVIGQVAPATSKGAVPPSFNDAWFVAHGAARFR